VKRWGVEAGTTSFGSFRASELLRNISQFCNGSWVKYLHIVRQLLKH
jgi:hypothetical protein